MTLELLTLLVLGLKCGSELNIAAFAHPALNRQPLEKHILMRSSFAALFGRVMPFWMTGSALLNLLLPLPFAHLGAGARLLAAAAFAIQVGAVVFPLIFPVPINIRIAKWTPQTLPPDWGVQEHRWDLYHSFRTAGLVVAFAPLALALAAH